MHSTKFSLSLGLIVISFGLLTGCESNITNNYYSAVSSPTPSATLSNAPISTATPSVTPSPSPTPSPTPAAAVATPTPTGNVYNLPDADSYVASINGAAGAAPTVTYSIQTSRTLKVKVTPLAAPNLTLPGYTDWVFPYGCIRLQVTVNGVTKTTDILRVDGVAQPTSSVCANSPTFQVLDFSNDVTGNGASSIEVSNAQYDNCRYVNPLTYGCSMSAIFQTHVVSSTITIQGDGTYMDDGSPTENPTPSPSPSPATNS